MYFVGRFDCRCRWLFVTFSRLPWKMSVRWLFVLFRVRYSHWPCWFAIFRVPWRWLTLSGSRWFQLSRVILPEMSETCTNVNKDYLCHVKDYRQILFIIKLITSSNFQAESWNSYVFAIILLSSNQTSESSRRIQFEKLSLNTEIIVSGQTSINSRGTPIFCTIAVISFLVLITRKLKATDVLVSVYFFF